MNVDNARISNICNRKDRNTDNAMGSNFDTTNVANTDNTIGWNIDKPINGNTNNSKRYNIFMTDHTILIWQFNHRKKISKWFFFK